MIEIQPGLHQTPKFVTSTSSRKIIQHFCNAALVILQSTNTCTICKFASFSAYLLLNAEYLWHCLLLSSCAIVVDDNWLGEIISKAHHLPKIKHGFIYSLRTFVSCSSAKKCSRVACIQSVFNLSKTIHLGMTQQLKTHFPPNYKPSFCVFIYGTLKKHD